MTLLAGLSAAAVVYLGLGLVLGLRPRFVGRPGVVARERPRSVAAWLAQADSPVRPRQLVAVTISLGAVGALLAVVSTGVPVFGVLAGVGAAAAPAVAIDNRRRQLQADRQKAWPDALRDLSAHLRANLSAHAGLCELARSGPAPLRRPFRRYQRLAAAVDQRVALQTVRAEMADPVSDRIIEILLVGLEQGPSVVVDILDELARSATEDLRLVEEARTAQLEVKLEARGAAVLPFVVLGLLCATSTAYRQFYQSPLGWGVVAFGVLVSGLGLIVISRLGRIPTEERVLVGGPG